MTPRNPSRTTTSRTRPGFTLIELVVTIGVIVVLVGVTLPAVNRMYADSNRADLENSMSGLLRSARMQAINNNDRGLFFYLDGDVQKCVIIEAKPQEADELISARDAADRYRVIPDSIKSFAPPFRVAPLGVLDEDDWQDDQLSNANLFTTEVPMTTPAGSRPNNHRNYFTILFSSDGRLQVGRNVYIEDLRTNRPTMPMATPGPTIGIMVGDADKYQDDTGAEADFDNTNNAPVLDLVVNEDGIALNFPSVAGALIYDDSAFAEIPPAGGGTGTFFDDQRRDIMINTGRPLYVVPQTGDVISGPLGENETPEDT